MVHNHSTRKEELGDEARFPQVLTTVSAVPTCSQLSNNPRVVVTDFRLKHFVYQVVVVNRINTLCIQARHTYRYTQHVFKPDIHIDIHNMYSSQTYI